MNPKLLVVDDDPMIHRMLNFAFKEENYLLESKFNSKEAMEWMPFNHHEVAVMVLDWEMPGVSGLELLKLMKKDDRYKDIPVVMLTAHTKKSDIQMGIDSGAYYYVTKPFNKDFLKSIVNRAVFDYQQLFILKKQLREAQNPFANLLSGTFSVRTPDDAQRMSLQIANASETPDKALLICELLTNAVEHGNLGIGYEEKTQLIEENRLYNEIMERLSLPEFKQKQALVNVKRESGILKVIVEDEGEGFDYRKYLEFDPGRIFDNHGRGIALAKSMLEINYLGKGNVVEVLIPVGNMN